MAIRKLVQATKFKEEMDPLCEAHLYAASRAQSVNTVVLPVLKNKGIVISDRNFITSLVFQGHFRSLGIDFEVKLNEPVIKLKFPDLVFFIDTDVTTAYSRLYDKDGDKWESMGRDLLVKARKGYIKVGKLAMFKDKWITIDGNYSSDEVFSKLVEKLVDFIG